MNSISHKANSVFSSLGTSAHGEGSALNESDADDVRSCSDDFEEARDDDDDVTGTVLTFIGALHEACVICFSPSDQSVGNNALHVA